MKRVLTTAAIIAALFSVAGCFVGCGTTTVSSTITGNPPTVSGKIYNSDSVTPAVNAAVLLYDYLNSTALCTTFTAEDGSFSASLPDSTRRVATVSIVGKRVGEWTVVRYFVPPKADTIRLEPMVLLPFGTYRGFVKGLYGGDPRNFVLLTFGGVPVAKTWPDSSGYFHLNEMPEGNYMLHFLDDSQRYTPATRLIQIFSGETTVQNDTITLKPVDCTVDNFDNIDKYSFPARWKIWDFPYPQFGANTVKPDGILADISLAVVDSGAYSGKSMHITVIQNPSADMNPSTVLEVSLTKGPERWADCTPLKYVSFLVKGKGNARVSLVSKYILDYPYNDNTSHLGTSFSIPGEWTLVRFTPDQFQPMPGSRQEAEGVVWYDVRSQINKITFSIEGAPGDTVDLWLDDINLGGMVPSDFQ
jgi:hypothetical protein